MAASEPPAPGRISRRHGRCANGCTGTSEVIRLCEALASWVRVSARSSAARDRSSASVAESCISDWSSVADLVYISHLASLLNLIGLPTSFALSQFCNAVTIGPNSPNFFAARVSKPSESFLVRASCSEATVRARESNAGGMDSYVAAYSMSVMGSERLGRKNPGSPVEWSRL